MSSARTNRLENNKDSEIFRQGQKAANKDGEFKELRAKIGQLAVENVTGGLLGPSQQIALQSPAGQWKSSNQMDHR